MDNTNLSTLSWSASVTENITLSVQPTVLFWVDLGIFLAVLLSNGFLLCVFYVNKELRTSFSVYVISLLFANVSCYCICFDSLNMINYPQVFRYLSPFACDVYQYADWVLAGAGNFAHALIAVNRVWATGFPVHYRGHHTKKLAVRLSVIMWFMVHVIGMPGVVTDSISYRMPLGIYGCQMDTSQQPVWAMAMLLGIYWFPLFIHLASYLFVLQKVSQLAHLRHLNFRRTHEVTTEVRTPEKGLRGQPLKHDGSNGFLVLTVTTVTVVFCWCPADVGWIMATFSREDPRPAWLHEGSWYLYSIQAIVDPLGFMISLPDVRKALSKNFQFLKRCFTSCKQDCRVEVRKKVKS